MGRPYPMELRERVVGACDEGMKPEEAAELFRVSARWIYNLLARRKETGGIAARAMGRGQSPKLEPHDEQIKDLVEAQPDATLEELSEQSPVPVSVATMWRRLQFLNLTLKKSSARR